MNTTPHPAVLIACLVATVVLEAENWPCLRGPCRQGVSAETGLPLSLGRE